MQSPKIIKMSSCALLQITRTFLELEGKYKQLTDILDKFRVFVTDLPTTCTSDELSKGKNIRCKIKITIFSVVIYADIDLTLRQSLDLYFYLMAESVREKGYIVPGGMIISELLRSTILLALSRPCDFIER